MAPALRRFATRRVALIAGGVVLVLVALLLLLLAFGWPLLRGPVERRLSAALDRPVRIGRLERTGGTLFSPILSLGDVAVAQPAWVGRGDMLRIADGRIRLPVLPLLFGSPQPQAIAIDGLRLALVRRADGRSNWQRERQKEGPSGAAPLDLGHLTMKDGIVSVDDAKSDRQMVAHVAIDPRSFRLSGQGRIAGRPATLIVTGAGVAEQTAWPFHAAFRSSIVSIRAEGRALKPLDLGHFTATVESQGRDLRDLDRVIEAGLFETQPYRLSARIVHDRPGWRIEGLKGRIGRSDIAADLTVDKAGDRTKLAGTLTSAGFDFDDLADDASQAKGSALAARTGPRLFPPTRIDLHKLRRLDAKVRFDLRRLLFKAPSSVQAASGIATLDDGVLTVSPVDVAIAGGHVTGTAVVRHQSGTPLLITDLTLRGARMERLFTEAKTATGIVTGRARLSGRGLTVREAAAHFIGTIGMVADRGTISRRIALVAGSDVGRALTADGGDRTAMRCLVARFRATAGVARPEILVLDTGVGRADGTGRILFAGERLDLSLSGQAKLGGGLKLDQPVRVVGLIKVPEIIAPPRATTVGGVLKMLGRAITGKTPPTVADADCTGLAARALR